MLLTIGDSVAAAALDKVAHPGEVVERSAEDQVVRSVRGKRLR
jgi:hypothetical protein